MIIHQDPISRKILEVSNYAQSQSPDIKKLGFMMKQLYDMLDPKNIQYESTLYTSPPQLNTSLSSNQVFNNRTMKNHILPLLESTTHKSDSPVLTLYQSPLSFPLGEPITIVQNICEIVEKCPINNGNTLNALYLYLVTIFMDLHAKKYTRIAAQRQRLFNFSRNTLINALITRRDELKGFGKNIWGTQTHFIHELLQQITDYNPYPEKPEQYRRRAPNGLKGYEADGGRRLRNKTRRGLRKRRTTKTRK